MKLSPRTVVTVVLVSGTVLFALFVVLNPALRYRWRHDGASLYKVLYNQLKDGDSREEVERLLGLGTPAANPARLLSANREFARRRPASYPDGAKDGDTFLGHRVGGGSMLYLEFRDGRLVNHIPSDFREYHKAVLIR